MSHMNLLFVEQLVTLLNFSDVEGEHDCSPKVSSSPFYILLVTPMKVVLIAKQMM